jgi:predicted transglutaminase-like cysteine proteinase
MAVLPRRALLPCLGALGVLAMAAGLPAKARGNDPPEAVRRPLRQFPSLFGSREIPADGLRPRLRSAAVLARSAEPPLHRLAAAGQGDVMPAAWVNLPQTLAGLPPVLQLLAVNRFVNRVRYVSDRSNYHVADHWATPAEFFARGGDCEDYAIAKFVALRRLGFHESRTRVALVFDRVRRLHHSILAACPGDALYVLDNQIRMVMRDTEVSRYRPVCSFDTRHLWLHSA